MMNSAVWGDNLDTDILRLAVSLRSAIENRAILLVPQHPIFDQICNARYNYYSDNVATTPSTRICLPTEVLTLDEICSVFQTFIIDRGKNRSLKNKVDSNELVLYINNKPIKQDIGNNKNQTNSFVPPPLSYYRYIIETRFWKKITLITNTIANDLVVNHLNKHYPKIKTLNIKDKGAWQYLLNASNVAIGGDLFAQISMMLSTSASRIWAPEYLTSNGSLVHKQATIYPIKISEYISTSHWAASPEQQHVQLKHNPADIHDDTRWVFTETEKCRSFEYCQSCRDTSSTGKLWRNIISQRFDVPNKEWDCPHGWKWGGKPSFKLWLKKKLGFGTIIKNTAVLMGVKPCIDCQKRGDKLDGKRV